MGEDALQACMGRARRPRGRDAGPHTRLHQEKRRQHSADAKRQSRTITTMFGPDGGPRIDRGMLSSKADELDVTIRKLTAMRDGLRHAAACLAPTYMECPSFQRLLGLQGAARLNR